MPSLKHGIAIISFMEQCDKEKDELIVIYNGNTGIVDSMTQEAEILLKDNSRRTSNANSMLAIPDNITDLLPNWDFRLESWRDYNKYGRSVRTIPQLNEDILEIKEISLYRSDGGSTKFIKILKVKASSFGQMLSIDN